MFSAFKLGVPRVRQVTKSSALSWMLPAQLVPDWLVVKLPADIALENVRDSEPETGTLAVPSLGLTEERLAEFPEVVEIKTVASSFLQPIKNKAAKTPIHKYLYIPLPLCWLSFVGVASLIAHHVAAFFLSGETLNKLYV